ncbi:EAL domain-containing protein [Desulfurivibrio dismutans]|uniref:EAL domain-containing protein n=1 Tax=Desulfurivibrio dismutans TaxID=1398908 RepID=UPI0023D9A4E5|nr:EAL domain-containing protein [Desulfurivibrio alkaliphilus]MDF1615650.1 EAL domain-containing protein [Desulfurivibrio alkaliphilus]
MNPEREHTATAENHSPGLRAKIYFTIAVALLVGVLFAYYSKQAKEQTTTRLTLMSVLNQLDHQQQELDGEILHSGFFLFHDYDRLHAMLARIDKSLQDTTELYSQVALDKDSPVPELLAAYHASLADKEELIFRFLTANSMLKNSAMYVPGLSRRIMLEHPGISHDYHRLLTDLTSALYLAHNSMDPDLLGAMAQPLEGLAGHRPQNEGLQQLHQALLAHGRVFNKTLPDYNHLLNATMDSSGGKVLNQLQQALQEENRRWLTRLNSLSYLFFAAFMGSVVLIILLLFKTERENQALNRMSNALHRAATRDQLTGLANRFAFDSDQTRCRHPLLLLINIDDFKHVNDLYGVRAGDYVLNELAAIFRQLLPESPWGDCYRLGGDDFGLLLDEEKEQIAAEELARRVLTAVGQAEFNYRDQPIRVNVSLGISRLRPLLETADLVLNEVKKHRLGSFLVYQEELNLQERIAGNLEVLENARRALNQDDVLAYYQPIVDNTSGEIIKYEALVRLRNPDGQVLSPVMFLEVVKESSLYPEFTRRMVDKIFADFADCRYGFSLNLSIADILEKEVRDYIMAKVRDYPEMAQRLTFEILESEGVENVEPVQAFIEQVKAAGCQIAIDDFGSGYSNFAHILQFKVDSIKIDASLIRNIHQDQQARVLVRTIVDFCRQLGIRTVAEFVHSEDVLRVVKELGIDYSQGYHLGQPTPHCRPE